MVYNCSEEGKMKVRQTLYIDQDLINKVKHKAIDENVSISDYVTEAILLSFTWSKNLCEKQNNSLHCQDK